MRSKKKTERASLFQGRRILLAGGLWLGIALAFPGWTSTVGVVNINTASTAELQLLPGVGTQRAAAMKEVSKSEASSPASGPPAEIEVVAELVARYHGVADTLRRADESVNRAIDAIAAFPDSPAKQALVATAVFAVSRDH